MSADAKAWQDDDGHWHAIHDGDCDISHDGMACDLVQVLGDVQACMNKSRMRWDLFVYKDGKAGLRGYT
jgi:hypothetical protein